MNKNSLSKKGLAFAIILLFLGMSINPLSVALQDFTKVTEMNNNPPSIPIISGPIKGVVGVEYTYSFVSEDPDGDDVYYAVAWKPGIVMYDGPYTSGEEIHKNHTWDEKGIYIIRAKAKDIHDATSDWGTLEVNIGNILYVDDDNTAGPWNGMIEYPYQYIQDGIDNATDGDTVFVYNGTYYENVLVDKSINLIGENKEFTIIDGSWIGDVVNIISDLVDISGFTIQHSEQSTSCDAGINLESNYSTITNNILSNNDWGADVRNSNHNIISDNIIRFNSGGAIHLAFSTNNIISNCNITNNGIRGIMLSGSDKNTISSNTFIRGGLESYYDSSHNTVFGNTINGKPLVYIEDESDITITDAGQVIIIMCENITIQGLILSNTSIGIQVRNSQECNIIGNTIFDNSHGASVDYSSQILIEGNTFRKNLWCGIGIYHDQGETEVLKNTVVNNRNGLYIFNCRNGVGIFNNNISSNNLGIDISSISSDCVVSGNEISNNNYGIDLSHSNNNIIYHNNFINNVQNAYDECDNIWDGGYPSGGNYWDDYNGVDNNGDGIGDTPYNISGGGNQDLYPWMFPWGDMAPVADFSYVINDLRVTFDPMSSFDRDGEIDYVTWDFGEPPFIQGPLGSVNHTYSSYGEYDVTLTVVDDDGHEGNKTIFIYVESPNQPPYMPSNPDPENNATWMSIVPEFSWTGGDPDPYNIVLYSFIFENIMYYKGPETTFFLIEPLDYNTTYHWQIIAEDNHGASTPGPIWSFTTKPKPESRFPYPELNGTMGENDWYISCVTIAFIDREPHVDCITYFRLNDGEWQVYDEPFIVCEDGEYSLEYYSKDDGIIEIIQEVEFKIDQTLPTIELTVERIGFRQWLFTADVADDTSGVARVEFYINGELVGEVTEAPFKFEWSGDCHTVQVVAYDNAGNSAESEVVDSSSQSLSQSQSILLSMNI